ncbi:hypothetical protein OHA21_46175 [Actinoplanes sp. NBC_00393]|uniref:hypothetical protein n=1 Tax=Actinoplanes sp. NBC_00393 TaxID=2975953 RepID=UPI002E22815E
MLIRRSVVPAALILAFAAGCANNNTIDAGAPAPAPSPSLNVVEPVPSGGGTTITGTVTEGVEPGCLLLKTTDGEHLLIFKDATVKSSVKAGSEITVVGKPEAGMMTTCMQGEPFVVSSVAAS